MNRHQQQSAAPAASASDEGESDLGFEIDPGPVLSAHAFNRRSKRIAQSSLHSGRMVVVATPACYFISALSPVVGLVALCVGLYGLASRHEAVGECMALASAGLAVLALGVGLLAKWTTSTTLDRTGGRYWQGIWPGLSRLTGWPAGQIDDIAAVQICRGYRAVTRTRGFGWWQVNLVLSHRPGERIAVMTHSAKDNIFEDAERLAHFLDKPLLDHTHRLIRPGPGGKSIRRLFTRSQRHSQTKENT
ncbi:hypothetical protein LCGC14_0397780 [marine sediment metagenome]|uniref:Uncharacterized protein n=1 Tax=marine sediment metagenome TaxID=412755 RepID=A0A0F9TFV0_9ZZZZ